MRFTVPRRSDAAIHRLASRLDRPDQPIAETWRLVCDSADRAGLRRPSYANVRRLVLGERRRRAELAAVVDETLAMIIAGRVPALPVVLERVNAANSKPPVEPRVSETQGFEGER
jgi:hypothetical protein